MQVDSSNFPLVWTYFKAPDADPASSPFRDFEALLLRRMPFVLLNDEGLDQNEHSHTHEERKQNSLWMKQHKDELREFVRAAIHVEPDATKRSAASEFAQLSEKFWGYPMVLAGTNEEAFQLAAKLLSNRTQAPESSAG